MRTEIISEQKPIEIDPDGVGGVDSFNVTCTLYGKFRALVSTVLTQLIPLPLDMRLEHILFEWFGNAEVQEAIIRLNDIDKNENLLTLICQCVYWKDLVKEPSQSI